MIKSDFLVIGSGIAGLSFAIKASKMGSVSLITKKELDNSSTNKAQGGVACVWDKSDSFQKHIQDTLTAGDGLCKKDIVELVVQEGPERIKELIDWGLKFSAKKGKKEFDLGLEAGHTRRRIFHIGDFTGLEIEKGLIKKLKSTQNIKIYEDYISIDLITTSKLQKSSSGQSEKKEKCLGAYVLNKNKNQVETFLAKVVVLATGGAGKVYLYTSNPDVSTGDGIAMGYRAGAVISNMEFVQFHPTCLFHPKAKSFLISEAVRGEGGILKLRTGKAFMKKYHPLKELAPRDIVARAIDNELKSSGDDYVLLDITHKPKKFLLKRFPNIYKQCLEYGIDMAKDPIPVVPAAHYFCGGILVNESGQTSINNLFAIGEVACTGLHGANRLASNSLLEALVFAERCVKKSKELVKEAEVTADIPKWDIGDARDSDESVVVTQNWEEIRLFMWNYVGIVRSNKRLERALRRIELFQQEIAEYYWNFIITSDLIELRNIATVAELIIKGARKRKESRGLQYNIDYPDKLPKAEDTLLGRFS
ncbi:MAG: L-aspartate oxidase [Endomicrobiales bacterium]|nr:L-aspartate oxidase [Endomicrobiales bacterium]